MSNHQLAIVIPAYKETYLWETLDSIANQTNKNFHLYIGDDCSPYDLKSVVDKFRDRISLTYHRFDTNLGGKDLVAQWERCIALTNDEPYIWLFSDDDTMEISCVEEFYKCLESNPIGELFHFNIRVIDELANKQIKDFPEFPQFLSAGKFLEQKLTGQIVSYVVEFIFTRKLHNLVGGFQNIDLAWGADFTTWLKMASHTRQGIITIYGNSCYVNWRKSLENISPNKSYPILLRKLYAVIDFASIIKSEIQNNPSKYHPITLSFKWMKFPLGDILRSRIYLKFIDTKNLCVRYHKQIGYPIQTFLAFIVINLKYVWELVYKSIKKLYDYHF